MTKAKKPIKITSIFNKTYRMEVECLLIHFSSLSLSDSIHLEWVLFDWLGCFGTPFHGRFWLIQTEINDKTGCKIKFKQDVCVCLRRLFSSIFCTHRMCKPVQSIMNDRNSFGWTSEYNVHGIPVWIFSSSIISLCSTMMQANDKFSVWITHHIG